MSATPQREINVGKAYEVIIDSQQATINSLMEVINAQEKLIQSLLAPTTEMEGEKHA